ncbi:hypothetical protein HDU87_004803 [Geranomyces variabilis]|uniref:Uncharacterized protein n=1 Tax=Geranomyces variabilis TaxID=109894 RepID=A0AAD5TN75_9FUNG|nr:hypothetical protein HDU87_004803 [Geranomyces variabilis]
MKSFNLSLLLAWILAISAAYASPAGHALERRALADDIASTKNAVSRAATGLKNILNALGAVAVANPAGAPVPTKATASSEPRVTIAEASSTAAPTKANKTAAKPKATGTKARKTAGKTAGKTANGGLTLPPGVQLIDKMITVQNIPLRVRVAAPTELLVGAGGAAANSTMGLNVLLHGDGGSPFQAFPNRIPRDGLMGVAILAPPNPLNKNQPVWGGGAGGNDRPLGPAHSAAINELIQTELPKLVNFDITKVDFTGVSGGSFLLAGFFIPTFASTYKNSAFLLNCGALDPVVPIKDGAAVSSLRIHFQSSTKDFPDITQNIAQTTATLVKNSKAAGLSAADIGKLVTSDATPVGGHCQMDGKNFVSGVTLMVDNYGSVMFGTGPTPGSVPGIGNVAKGVAAA